MCCTWAKAPASNRARFVDLGPHPPPSAALGQTWGGPGIGGAICGGKAWVVPSAWTAQSLVVLKKMKLQAGLCIATDFVVYKIANIYREN